MWLSATCPAARRFLRQQHLPGSLADTSARLTRCSMPMLWARERTGSEPHTSAPNRSLGHGRYLIGTIKPRTNTNKSLYIPQLLLFDLQTSHQKSVPINIYLQSSCGEKRIHMFRYHYFKCAQPMPSPGPSGGTRRLGLNGKINIPGGGARVHLGSSPKSEPSVIQSMSFLKSCSSLGERRRDGGWELTEQREKGEERWQSSPRATGPSRAETEPGSGGRGPGAHCQGCELFVKTRTALSASTGRAPRSRAAGPALAPHPAHLPAPCPSL